MIQVYYGVILRKSFVLYERWILQLRAQMFLENNLITTWLTGMDFRYGELALELPFSGYTHVRAMILHIGWPICETLCLYFFFNTENSMSIPIVLIATHFVCLDLSLGFRNQETKLRFYSQELRV